MATKPARPTAGQVHDAAAILGIQRGIVVARKERRIIAKKKKAAKTRKHRAELRALARGLPRLK